jgi:hypothetical protein
MMWVDVALNERVVVVIDGKPARYLGPGRHRVFVAPWRQAAVKRMNVDALTVELRAEELALVPAGELQAVSLGAFERALVSRRGRPAKWLLAGEHLVWTVDRLERRSADGRRELVPSVTVETIDVAGVETAPLRNEARAMVPASDYVEATAAEGTTVVRYVDGALEAVLGAGRHAAWTVRKKVTLAVIDLREKLVQVTGQEVMTKDRVTLRLNLSAAFRVADARRLATVARAPDEVLYLAVQLAAREAVATRTEANVILRREETAATRSMAQTARVLAENPLLVRLKELEAYKELAAKVGQVHLVLGEGALPQLQLKA